MNEKSDTYPDDTTSLYEHIVNRCGNRPRAYTIGVCGCPSDLNRMDVRITGDERDDGEVDPVRCARVEGIQCDQEW